MQLFIKKCVRRFTLLGLLSIVALGPSAPTLAVAASAAPLTDTHSLAAGLVVRVENEPPTVTDIPNLVVNRDRSSDNVPFKIVDTGTPAVDLTLSAASSNETLAPVSGIVFGGSGANRTVTVTPAPGQIGEATITVTVSDGSLSTNETFLLKVVTPPAEGSAFGWGSNSEGQLGNNSNTSSNLPVAVYNSGALAGKTIIAVAAAREQSFAVNSERSLALSSDGQVYSWGYDVYGQHGSRAGNSSKVPVAVSTSGVLAGKRVIAIAAGTLHNLALTADGRVYSWGYDGSGQLGNDQNTGSNSSLPVAVDISGVLAGKTVTAIAAGDAFSLALTSDGKLYSWGYNYYGQLGNGATTSSPVPTPVDMTGALTGKTVTAIAAGGYHGLAVTSDGRVFSWGDNSSGKLGNGNTTWSTVPVAVDNSGALAGKTVVAVAGGTSHSLALTSDGRVYAWGDGSSGQLGSGNTVSGTDTNPDSSVPVPVIMSGAMAGRTITAIAAGGAHSLALSSNGLAFGWGRNASGRLGDGTNLNTNVPVAVDTSDLLAGKPVSAIAAGYDHSLAVAAAPNDAPTISDIADQTIVHNASTGALAFTIGDAETPADQLIVYGSSDNQDLVPNANIVFGGSGANRTVTITRVAEQTGVANITVTVSDRNLSANDTFVLTVTLPADQIAPAVSVTSPLDGAFLQ